ncbi:hypothetical protein BSL78_20660 [Apostichopus japonicus]|uniref:ATP-dependent DNA helicase n=1 Tax=Stichopus japonicus TaxID=307972 RepID=A0A2G8K3F0_STIJA|nr:hypothetical protein BSL78_20660 [Apostichopus japonicus]
MENNPEKYYQGLLRLYLPHTKKELRNDASLTYEEYFQMGTVHYNHGFKPVKDIVGSNMKNFDEAWELASEQHHKVMMHGVTPRYWVQMVMLIKTQSMKKISTNHMTSISTQVENSLTTHDINFTHSIEQNFEQNVDTRYQSLNTNERKLFRYITSWCYQKINDRNTTPFHIFLTAGAGTGKSLLIECINHQSEKIFRTNLPSAAGVTVLLLTFTGTAAFNIHGQTIHSALSIRNTKMPYIPLGQDKLNTYMLTYA